MIGRAASLKLNSVTSINLMFQIDLGLPLIWWYVVCGWLSFLVKQFVYIALCHVTLPVVTIMDKLPASKSESS